LMLGTSQRCLEKGESEPPLKKKTVGGIRGGINTDRGTGGSVWGNKLKSIKGGGEKKGQENDKMFIGTVTRS